MSTSSELFTKSIPNILFTGHHLKKHSHIFAISNFEEM